MNTTHVVMILTNPFKPDPRVHKEARSLVNAGYQVTIICWDRQQKYPTSEILDGINIERISVQSGYNVGSKQIFYLPKFWKLALKRVKALKPDILHCHDLDTTLVGYLYSIHHRIPWIFDAHECYPEQMKPQISLPIYYILLWLERFIIPRATHVITVGELLAQRFRNFDGTVSIVGNYAHLNPKTFPKLTRTDLNIPPDNLIVAYIGGFTNGRLIMPLIYATKYLSNVTILLVGDGPQRQAIKAELPTHPQTIYVGQVPSEHIPAYTKLANVIYYGLKTQSQNNHYSTPNALFNAMIASKPILTTNIGEIAQIVRNNACGIVVNDATPQSLSTAIEQLKDEAVRQKMSKNAYQLAQSKYRWSIAEKKLLTIYTNLLAPDNR